MAQNEDNRIKCTDACGIEPIDPEKVDYFGWQRLHITGRYRCLKCRQALDAVNKKKEQNS